MSSLILDVDNLIEEVKKIIDSSGKYRTITDRQFSGKKSGMVWDGKKYRVQTGTEKLRHKKASVKRSRTMKTGKADRARRMKIKTRMTDRIRSSKRVDN